VGFFNWLLQREVDCINSFFLIHILNDFFKDFNRFVTKVELTFPEYIIFTTV